MKAPSENHRLLDMVNVLVKLGPVTKDKDTVEHGKRVGKARSVTKDKRLLDMVNVLVKLGPVTKNKRLLDMVNVLVKIGLSRKTRDCWTW